MIGRQGAAHLSDALKDVNCKLTQLKLGNNEIGDQGAAHLSDALKDVNCKLTESLDLDFECLMKKKTASINSAPE